jgi:hypothetical protein
MSDPNPKMMFGDPVGPWHDWFAWFPIQTYDQRFAWFRWVRRRSIQKHQYLRGGADFWWQYHVERIAA